MAVISVLVPVYNVEKYIERCLDSIVQQTFIDMEILCVDDGSTDGSGRILDQYAQRDSRIRVIHKENGGYGNTMNQAVAAASGEYIGIVESDDYIEPDMYEVMYEAMTRWQLDFVKTDYYQLWEREDGTQQNDYHALTQKKEMYGQVMEPNRERESYFLEKFTWNGLYRKEFLEKHEIRYQETPGASYQDNGFWFQTFYFAERVMFLPGAFYHYRQDNPDSSINSDKKVWAMKKEYDYIRDFLVRQKETDRWFYHVCFHFRMDGCLYTLSMLADQYKPLLAKMIQGECDYYEGLGEACFQWLPGYKLKTIGDIRKDPEKYADSQIRQHEKIRGRTKGYACIVIYGAGVYGRSVYEQIRRIVDPSCGIHLAVTDLKNEKQYYYSCVVKEIGEFGPLKEQCLVIIAVKYGTSAYEEMRKVLEGMGFRNILDYRDIM